MKCTECNKNTYHTVSNSWVNDKQFIRKDEALCMDCRNIRLKGMTLKSLHEKRVMNNEKM